jgi:hypothetical protein
MNGGGRETNQSEPREYEIKNLIEHLDMDPEFT